VLRLSFPPAGRSTRYVLSSFLPVVCLWALLVALDVEVVLGGHRFNPLVKPPMRPYQGVPLKAFAFLLTGLFPAPPLGFSLC